ncbi:armadillo-type protein [Limtongia smithiae]|uniref:armadillo-type protein n=1 Tax=Limtongia smithiae TaxID=1125753 RepID=UPI0034CEEFCA
MAIDTGLLLQALYAAASQEPAHVQARQEAEKMLKEWEIQPGLYSLLQDVFLDATCPNDVRWISIIYFKNGIDKYWRKSAPNAITKEEKVQIRAKITRTFEITSTTLAAQNAFAIARIAKYDFPVEWPSLFSDILSVAEAAHSAGKVVLLYQILNVLNQVVKVLSASRFGKSRAALIHAAPTVVRRVGQWYFEYTQLWTNLPRDQQLAINFDASASDDETLARSKIGYLSLKICRRLVAEGYDFAHKAQEACEFYQAATEHFTAFVEQYTSLPTEILRRHIKTLGKFYDDLAERQPTSFLLMPRTFEVIGAYLSVLQTQAAAFHRPEFEEEEFWEKVLLRGLLLFRKCVKMAFGDGMATIKYKTADDRAETKAAVEMLKTQVFTDHCIVQVHDILLWSYLRLKPSDLEKWANEPEEFVHDEMQNSWEYQLRPCTEKVYIDLLINYKELLAPRLMESFWTLKSRQDASDDDILTRDAVYCAFAITSNALFEDVDFDAVFVHMLSPQVMSYGGNVSAMYRVILRRIALIVVNWISVKCGQDTRKYVYEVLARLMDPDYPLNDVVVQLTASSALRSAVDEWDFKLPMFLPYLQMFLMRLIVMIGKAENIETKLALLGVVSVIVEVSEQNITAYADKIVELLPVLWEQAGDEHILKGAILQALTNLIKSTGSESIKFHSLYIPLIGGIVDPKSELHVYLLEDALELWQGTISNTAEATPELLSLVPTLLETLDLATENLRIELQILEGYVALATEFVVREYGAVMFRILTSFIGKLKQEACHAVAHVIEIVIQRLPLQAYINLFADTGLLARILDAIFDRHESTINITRFLTVYARLTLVDPQAVVQFCDLYAQEQQRMNSIPLPPEDSSLSYFGALLDAWLEKVDNMGHPRTRKLTALALDTFLNNPALQQRPEIAQRRAYIVSVRDDVFAELQGEEVSLDVSTSMHSFMTDGYSG